MPNPPVENQYIRSLEELQFRAYFFDLLRGDFPLPGLAVWSFQWRRLHLCHKGLSIGERQLDVVQFNAALDIPLHQADAGADSIKDGAMRTRFAVERLIIHESCNQKSRQLGIERGWNLVVLAE